MGDEIQLDHAIVPVRDRRASAELLAFILGVPWAESGVGPFSPVYVNEGLTLDFDQADGPYPVQHYCFRVSEAEFDAIVTRIRERDIEYRSTPHGPVDMQINTQQGGHMVYWNQPDGHVWEVLTVSYARQPQETAQGDATLEKNVAPTRVPNGGKPMKKLLGSVVLIVLAVFASAFRSPEPAPRYSFKVRPSAKGVELECVTGCNWTHLSGTCENEPCEFLVDESGLTGQGGPDKQVPQSR